MPDRDVKTIQDLIFYQYAKIIARRAFGAADGKEAKKQSYGFIKNTFRELRSGAKSWSEITREDWQLVEAEKRCIYCGVENDLHKEHIVLKSLKIFSKNKSPTNWRRICKGSLQASHAAIYFLYLAPQFIIYDC
jgi:hypothetical protein